MYSKIPEDTYRIERPGQKKWYKRWWGVILILFFVAYLIFSTASSIFVLSLLSRVSSGDLSGLASINSERNGSGEVPQSVFGDGHLSIGPVGAELVIVEFVDFECPFCRQAAGVMDEFLFSLGYTDRVRVIFRHFPLTEIHPNAITAAMAIECANEQDKFWKMHNIIFQNQENISNADLKRYAVELGMDGLQFSSCLDTAKYFDVIQNDFSEGRDLGVNATPTFFIRDKQIEGVPSLAQLEQAANVYLGI